MLYMYYRCSLRLPLVTITFVDRSVNVPTGGSPNLLRTPCAGFLKPVTTGAGIDDVVDEAEDERDRTGGG